MTNVKVLDKRKNSIDQINVIIPGTEKRAEIDLIGRNLIITGANGSGKTRFLKCLHQNIYAQIVNKDYLELEELLENVKRHKEYMKIQTPSGRLYDYYKREKEEFESQLLQVKKNRITLISKSSFCEDYNERKALVRYFEAIRESDISYSGPVESLDNLKSNLQNLAQDSSNIFERYLVTIRHLRNDIIAEEGHTAESDDINRWFDKLTEDFKELFEDDSLSISYERNEQCYYLKQDNKEKYRFNQLSSGYQSILSIYADLVTKVTLQGITPDKLSGVVFIDEIDAHLHVSLQRKIFSFFTNSFPNIQFIVTTHSPFVIQSVSDVVIYDISKCEQLDDLSMYSYESIVKGLLGVDIISANLANKINELSRLIKRNPMPIDEVETLIKDLEINEEYLDMQSRAFLLIGKNALLDAKAVLGDL